MGVTDQCMYCMAGSYQGGICSHCRRRMPDPARRDRETLPVGYLLHGQYVLGEVLGRGGFGITYAAWDRRLNQRVAVKELFPVKDVERAPDRRTLRVKTGQETAFSELYRCFEQEARTLMALQRLEGVVSLYHVFGENNTAYYAMEYLDGENLGTFLLNNGPMAWDELRPKLRTLLDALLELHSRGLIHRDISPDNIFLTRDGRVRLIDFGSARNFHGADHFTVYLKKCFAPLEQYLTDGKQGPWTDVYSLSVTVYYTLSGKLPPTATERNMGTEPTPLESLCPDLPRSVAQTIARGMEVKAENRFQDIRSFAQALYPAAQPVSQRQEKYLTCHSGFFQGRRWRLMPGTSIRVGRRTDCEICYPMNAQGVSRVQFTVSVDEGGGIRVRDESSFGTVVFISGQSTRLPPQQWQSVGSCWLCFGQREQFLIQ